MEITTFKPELQDQSIIFFQEMWKHLDRKWQSDNNIDKDIFDIRTYYQNKGEEFWIVMDNGTIIGTAGLRLLSPSIAEFKRFYVHPSFQGQGIGSVLLNLAIQKAKDEGYNYIRLDTSPKSQAMKMFVKKGFVEIAPYYKTIFAQIFMELKLTY